MKSSLHILHIEDSVEDCELIQNLLRKEGLKCEVSRVETRSEVFNALQNESFDLILSDCKLPAFSGLHALEIARALKPETPFVFVSGTIGEETAIESLRNGATDYVLKEHLSRLVPAVRRALAEAEEKRLCRKLQQRLHEAGRLEAISTLSNGIAHDFNNILTIILGHTSLLSTQYDKPDRVQEINETIRLAAKRASDVVQQLLAFAHKSEGHAVPTDLNRRLQESMSVLKACVPEKHELIFEPAAHLPNILVDVGQLNRILINLIVNAVDSMPTGGRITLSTTFVSVQEIPDLLPELATDYYVGLKVADTGVGMDPLIREHIFEPFYTTKERGRGTGLGLPVVYGLMQAHHGSIEVASEPGKGTTISLYFPVPQEAVTPASSQLSNPDLNGSETILVVDDEPDVGFYLETILQNHGYRVLTAQDHKQAIDLFKAHREEIQLVLSDVGLPKVDGITLCSKLKELKLDLKIILCSGYSPKDFKKRMNDLGSDVFLAKPYNTHEILQCVRSVLDNSAVQHSA